MSKVCIHCPNPVRARGLCGAHYMRWHTYGDPLGHAPSHSRYASPQERFWSKVDKSGECWIWTGALGPNGYGRFNIDGATRYPHRISWTWENGPIPDGLPVDHLCRNRACVNPNHLEPVTHAENCRRSRIARGYAA